MSPRIFDIGDPEPEDVLRLVDYRAEYYEPDLPDVWNPYWGRTPSGQWKGYTDGGKTYLMWDELTRRYGPLREAEA